MEKAAPHGSTAWLSKPFALSLIRLSRALLIVEKPYRNRNRVTAELQERQVD